MTTGAIEGLNSSEEREGQRMVPAHGRKQMHGLDRRNLQLRFHQCMFPDSFFTERNVEGQGGAPIHVKLIDTSTGDVVSSGPESCVKLKVVVVEGDFNNEDGDDWTQEDFESRVVKEREGKRPLLIGNSSVSLEGGVGSLGKFSFTDNSSWTRSKKFRLGVKVALDLWEDIRVREAITNPFVVKDRRGKVYEKHYPPALDDEVWRLETIGKNGPFHNRLDSKGISKVKDFLWLLGMDAQGLRKILGSSMKDKTWDTLVEHAKTCDLSGKYHVNYADKTKNSGVAFKNMSELCRLTEGGKYYSAETLSDSQEVFAETLKKEAYAKRKDIVEYDDLLPLEMNPSKRARSSQNDIVAPESCPSDTDQRVSPAFPTHVAPRPGLLNPGPAVGVAGGLHGFFDHTVECGSSSSVLSENYESGSRTSFGSIGDMVSAPKCHVYYADNTKNSGVVFKIISDQLCGLIEGGAYYSAETLSDSQKVLLDTLMKKPYENRMHVVEYDGRMLLNMKQSKRASSSRTEVVIEAPADYHVSLEQQVSLPRLSSSVPPEQTFMNSVVAVGGGVGYDENFGNRYPVHSHRSNAQMQLESNTVGQQMQLVSSSHQSQITRNDHISQPESASCFGFQSIGSSGLSSNLISYDDQSAGYNNNRGADEEFSEEGNWEYDGRMLLNMKQSKRASSSRTQAVIEARADYHVSLDQQVSLPHLPSSVPSEQTFMHSVVAVGGSVGYDENFGNRYPVHSHRSNAHMQLESNAVGRQMQLMSSSHQSQITRNDHMSQPESASCLGFQSIGSSGLPLNLISYDDQSAGYNNNRGADEFFSEEEIRMRSHEMLENDEMQQLLRLFSTGAAPANASNDGYPYSSYIQPPSTNLNFEKDHRLSGKVVVGWLRLKAALRWGIFIRKRAAERRAELVELED